MGLELCHLLGPFVKVIHGLFLAGACLCLLLSHSAPQPAAVGVLLLWSIEPIEPLSCLRLVRGLGGETIKGHLHGP